MVLPRKQNAEGCVKGALQTARLCVEEKGSDTSTVAVITVTVMTSACVAELTLQRNGGMRRQMPQDIVLERLVHNRRGTAAELDRLS